MIALFGSSVGREELEQISQVFDRQWLGHGEKAEEFERKIAAKCGVPSFLFLNSGSNSLQMAIRILDLKVGSEVILPSFTWIACANAIMLNGLRPVFCDVDRETFNLRPEDVEEKITTRTSAIMVVHYAGKPVDMDSIRSFGFPIIEDAAHAIDSVYNGKHCGTLGDVGILSFDAVKNLTTGEGGGVIAQDEEKMELARVLRYCGISKSGFQASRHRARWWEYEIHDTFPKMLNNDIAASIGLAQLEKLPIFQARRKDLWDRYTDLLETEVWAKDWLIPPPGPGRFERHSYFTYLIRLKDGSRDDLAHFLYEKGIYTSLRFHPLHLNPIYKSDGSLPNCEWLNEVGLCIPFHHRLSDGEVSVIFDALKEYSEKRL
jgi:dTDP-4-amino-4,6-dideoxygalactose transaminase